MNSMMLITSNKFNNLQGILHMMTVLFRAIITIGLFVLIAVSLITEDIATILKCLMMGLVILIALVDRITYKK